MKTDINNITAFAISGKADDQGRETWPLSFDDRDLSDKLLIQAGAKESTRLDIQVNLIKNVRYTYYHFLKLHNVAERPNPKEKKPIGRAKSFFGLSLRFEDCYCKDIVGIYNLLEYIFTEYIEGTVLKRTQYDSENYLVYQIREFAEADTIFRKAENAVRKELLQFIDDIEIIPTDIRPNNNGQILQYNLDETGSKAFFDSLFFNSEVYVSTEYLSLEKQAELQKEENEKLAKNLHQKEESLQIEKQKNESQNKKIKAKEVEINELKEQLEQLDKKQKSIKDGLTIADGKSVNDFILSVEQNTQLLRENLQHLRKLSEEQVKLWDQIQILCGEIPSTSLKEGNKEKNKNKYASVMVLFQKESIKKWGGILFFLLLVVLLIKWLTPPKPDLSEPDKETHQNIHVQSEAGTDEMRYYRPENGNSTEEKMEEETFKVTWIDLLGEGISSKNGVSYIKHGEYVFGLKTGTGSQRKEALGNGTLSCDNPNVEVTQDKASGLIIIPEQLKKDTKITLIYQYHHQGEKNEYSRELTIE